MVIEQLGHRRGMPKNAIAYNGPGRVHRRRFVSASDRHYPTSFSSRLLPVSIDAPSCFRRPNSSDEPQRSTILPSS